MARTRTLTAITAVVVLGAALASTQAYSTYSKWGTLKVSFYVNPANRDVSQNAAIAALQGSMDVWNTQSGTPFRFSYAGQVSDTSTGYDKKNVVLFRNSTNSGAIASTYSWTSNGVLVDSDIVYWDGGFKLFTGTSGCSSGVYVEDIGAHELGHAMGLSHSNVSDATMLGSYKTCSQTQRTLSSDDIAGAKKLYGSSGSTTDTAPTATILAPKSGTSVTSGTAVAFAGAASDTPDGDVSSYLIWRSNLDGKIGIGASFSKTLTAGSHTITASVTDSTGHTTSSTTLVSVAQSATTSATLTATARTSRDGDRKTRLVWSGLTSTKADIYRNGAKVSTVANDGLAGDPVPSKGTYTYKVCAASTSTCTNQASVTY